MGLLIATIIAFSVTGHCLPCLIVSFFYYDFLESSLIWITNTLLRRSPCLRLCFSDNLNSNFCYLQSENWVILHQVTFQFKLYIIAVPVGMILTLKKSIFLVSVDMVHVARAIGIDMEKVKIPLEPYSHFGTWENWSSESVIDNTRR